MWHARKYADSSEGVHIYLVPFRQSAGEHHAQSQQCGVHIDIGSNDVAVMLSILNRWIGIVRPSDDYIAAKTASEFLTRRPDPRGFGLGGTPRRYDG
jgi:hypothetical protein